MTWGRRASSSPWSICEPPIRSIRAAGPSSTTCACPTIVGHAHVVELGPAARIDRIGGSQIDQGLLEALRPHVMPPIDVARMPAFQRLEHAAVFAQADIVRDLGGVIDLDV